MYHNCWYWDGGSFYEKVVGYSIFLHGRCIRHEATRCPVHRVAITFKRGIFVQNAVMTTPFPGILITLKCDNFLIKMKMY